MKEERLDNIFRQELGQHDSGTPDHLWAGIEARRKKPNRAIAWWATGLAAIFVVGLSGWFLLTPDSISTQKELTVETHAPIADAILSPTPKGELSTDKPQQALANETVEEIQTVSTAAPIAIGEKTIRNAAAKDIEAVPNPTITATSDFIKKSAFTVAKNEAPIASLNENITVFSAPAEKAEMSEITRLPQLKSDLLTIDLGEIKGPEGCYNFGGGSNGPLLDALSFDLIGGPGIAMKKLENKGDSEFDYHVAARDSTENQWYEFGATLRANFRYTSGLALRIGLNYSQINEVFEIRDGNATQTTEIRDADGNIINVIVEEGELYKKTYNRLRFIDIPVMLGYEWTRKKWTFAVNAGPSFNYRSWQRGEFLDENLDPVVFTTGKGNQSSYFKEKIGINFVGSVGISRQIKDNLDWHIEPQVRYMPNSIGTTKLEQRYTNIGIYTGLRYYFVCRQRK